MENKNYSMYNADHVLNVVNEMIEHYTLPVSIEKVCDELSIFDWWPERLNLNHLKQMQSFLKNAIKLGYDKYVCFKVGAPGCANGMWAHKKESINGYSPDGEAIYRSFTPDYTYYSACDKNGNWLPDSQHYNEVKTVKQLTKLIDSLKRE